MYKNWTFIVKMSLCKMHVYDTAWAYEWVKYGCCIYKRLMELISLKYLQEKNYHPWISTGPFHPTWNFGRYSTLLKC